MTGLFDKLQNELENREDEGGISLLDLADLPLQLRKIMRFMLREVEVTFEHLWKHAESLPETEKMTRAELSGAIKTLTKQGWLVSMGEKDKTTYRVNLRRKPGSNLADSIWAALDEIIEQRDISGSSQGGK